MTQPFNKPPLTYAQQVAQLQARGMEISDPSGAAFYLQHLNYYRLAAYWLPFEADHSTHQFQTGTNFNDVLNLYVFDRELRLHVLDAIERVEVSIRGQWAYQLAHLHGAHAHLDVSLASRPDRWKELIETTKKEVDRSDEAFIRHLKTKYQEALPPVWAACEVMSIGTLSKWYNNLSPVATRRAIAGVYSVDHGVLASWLHHFSILRNTCAHHSRLWNREFTVTPQLPRSKPSILVPSCVPGSRKVYNTLAILAHLMDVIAPNHQWKTNLRRLLKNHQIQESAMGFPTDWERLSIWK